MKILLCHNYYQQPGGEDQVFVDEAQLLESYGHEVIRYTLHNDAIRESSSVSVAIKTLWNRETYRELTNLIAREKPAVTHFTNTFPLISPAAYYAAKRARVPVVQSLHNYRLLCPASTFYRDGKVCEDCLGKTFPSPAISHACYRSSRAATATVAAMTTFHRFRRTWHRAVDQYVALSHFSAAKFIAGGIPRDKIVVKPNFLTSNPTPGTGDGGYALFVGRLTPEKGIETLLQAWESLNGKIPLRIVGDGPLAEVVAKRASQTPGIEWLGRRNGVEVLDLMRGARCLVMPSEWYECCPKTLIETLAVGTPGIVSRLGAMAEMIDHRRTGLHFEPGNAQSLVEQVTRLAIDDNLASQLRRNARAEYLARYTAEANYEMLMAIYSAVTHTAMNHRIEQHTNRELLTQDVQHDTSEVNSLAQSL